MMILRIKWQRNSYAIVYLLVYATYSFFSILDSTLLKIGQVMQYIRWGTMAILLLLFIGDYFKKRQSVMRMILSFSVVIFFFSAAIISNRLYLTIYAFFILLSQKMEFDEVISVSLGTTLFSVVTILMLCRLGVLKDYLYYSTGNRVAHCYGFSYYSTLPFIVFYCVLMYIFLRKDKIKLVEYVGILMLNYFIYTQTTLRLTFYLTIIVVVINLILSKSDTINLNKKPIAFISTLLFPIGALVTYYFMVAYNSSNENWRLLNRFLSSRLYLMSKGYYIYGINLFGNSIEMRGNTVIRKITDYFYIDSGFAYSLLGYGLVFTVLVVALYSILFRYSCLTNNKHLFVWLTAVFIFTLINNTWVTINYNPILILSFPALDYLRSHQMRRRRWKFRYAKTEYKNELHL